MVGGSFDRRESYLQDITLLERCCSATEIPTVKKGVVRRLPRKTVLALLTDGGTIDCMVTGGKRHSADLSQGSLEVPRSFSQCSASLFILGFM